MLSDVSLECFKLYGNLTKKKQKKVQDVPKVYKKAVVLFLSKVDFHLINLSPFNEDSDKRNSNQMHIESIITGGEGRILSISTAHRAKR